MYEIELINCIRYRDMDMDHVLFIVRVNISTIRVCNQQQRIVQTFNAKNLFIICNALCHMNPFSLIVD